MAPGGAAALAIFIIAIVSCIGLAGYVYYRQVHAFINTFILMFN